MDDITFVKVVKTIMASIHEMYDPEIVVVCWYVVLWLFLILLVEQMGL